MVFLHTFLSLLVACQIGEPTWAETKADIKNKFPQVRQMSIDEFRKESVSKAFVVDVRKPEEYNVSHLQNAVNLVYADSILYEFEKSSKSIILLYCSVGYRSSEMAWELQSKTKCPVYNLEGSIFEWANAGLPIYRGEKPVEKVHPYNSYWGQLLEKKYRE